MDLLNEYILELDLSGNDTINSLSCPRCNKLDDKQFSISRLSPDKIAYICFRASCSFQGFVNSFTSNDVLKDYKKNPKKTKDYRFKRKLVGLPVIQVNTLKEKYGLTREEIINNGLKYDYREDRLYQPIFNKYGFKVGATCKIFNGSRSRPGKPKTITYFENNKVYKGLHYPCSSSGDSNLTTNDLVIVEDILSSIKVSRHAPCVALLGTHINDTRILDIRKESDTVVLMLDADAYKKALKYESTYSYLFNGFRVVKPRVDPKELKDEEIRNYIG